MIDKLNRTDNIKVSRATETCDTNKQGETAMIRVFSIDKAHSGFGMYKISVEGSTLDYSSASEYADAVSRRNRFVLGWVTSDTIEDTKSSIWDDSELQAKLVQAVEDANGKVYGGHGVIVAFGFRYGDDITIQLESIDVIE